MNEQLNFIQDTQRKKNMEFGSKFLAPLASICNFNSQFLKIISDDTTQNNELVRYEVIFQKEQISLKEIYSFEIRHFLFVFENMRMTLNGRSATDKEISIFQNRMNQAVRDYNQKRVQVKLCSRSELPS